MSIAFISTILGHPWDTPGRLWTDLATRSQVRGEIILLALSVLTGGGLWFFRRTERQFADVI